MWIIHFYKTFVPPPAIDIPAGVYELIYEGGNVRASGCQRRFARI